MANVTATRLAAAAWTSGDPQSSTTFSASTDDWLLAVAHIGSAGGGESLQAVNASGMTVTMSEIGSAGGFVDDWCRVHAFLGKVSAGNASSSFSFDFSTSISFGGYAVYRINGCHATAPEVSAGRQQFSAIAASQAARANSENLRLVFWGSWHDRTTTANTDWTQDYELVAAFGLHVFTANSNTQCAPTWSDTSTSFLAGFGLEFQVVASASISALDDEVKFRRAPGSRIFVPEDFVGSALSPTGGSYKDEPPIVRARPTLSRKQAGNEDVPSALSLVTLSAAQNEPLLSRAKRALRQWAVDPTPVAIVVAGSAALESELPLTRPVRRAPLLAVEPTPVSTRVPTVPDAEPRRSRRNAPRQVPPDPTYAAFVATLSSALPDDPPRRVRRRKAPAVPDAERESQRTATALSHVAEEPAPRKRRLVRVRATVDTAVSSSVADSSPREAGTPQKFKLRETPVEFRFREPPTAEFVLREQVVQFRRPRQ